MHTITCHKLCGFMLNFPKMCRILYITKWKRKKRHSLFIAILDSFKLNSLITPSSSYLLSFHQGNNFSQFFIFGCLFLSSFLPTCHFMPKKASDLYWFCLFRLPFTVLNLFVFRVFEFFRAKIEPVYFCIRIVSNQYVITNVFYRYFSKKSF